MAIIIERKDYNFLLIALKFCDKIDNYIELLGLDEDAVEEFKGANALFSFVFNNGENYKSCAESFTRYQIDNMRINLSYLAQSCRNSPNYTIGIGQELGIEVSVFAFLPN
ncbi:MAG: hypothetical protein JWO06_1176 [Bacteroidota bacterium]|nr:hypothetical protein [Bacteroidota bacterium]